MAFDPGVIFDQAELAHRDLEDWQEMLLSAMFAIVSWEQDLVYLHSKIDHSQKDSHCRLLTHWECEQAI